MLQKVYRKGVLFKLGILTGILLSEQWKFTNFKTPNQKLARTKLCMQFLKKIQLKKKLIKSILIGFINSLIVSILQIDLKKSI